MTAMALRDKVPALSDTGPAMLRLFSAVFALLASVVAPAVAQEAPRSSECLAMSNAPPRATPVSLRQAAATTNEVAIAYAGHSTYYIDTPGGCGSRPISAAPTPWCGCPTSSP